MSRGSQETPRSTEYGILLDLLREARLASGMAQKEICDKLGKPKNYVIKVERGERRIDVVELFALCKAMDTDPMDLLSKYAAQTTSKGHP